MRRALLALALLACACGQTVILGALPSDGGQPLDSAGCTVCDLGPGPDAVGMPLDAGSNLPDFGPRDLGPASDL